MFDEWNSTVACCKEATLTFHFLVIFSILIGSALCAAFAVFIYRAKVIHSNLRMILIISPIIDILVSCARIPDNTTFTGKLSTSREAVFFKGFFLYWTVLCPLNLQLENIWALWRFKSYDAGSNSFPFVMTALFLAELGPLTFIGYLYSQGTFTIPAYVISTSILIALQFPFAFTGLVKPTKTSKNFGDRTYEELWFLIQFGTRQRVRAVLQHRYALGEKNVQARYAAADAERSAQLLKIYVPYVMLSVSLAMALTLVLVFVGGGTNFYIFLHAAAHGPSWIRPFVSMAIVIRFHPVLWRRAREQWRKIKRTLGLVLPTTSSPIGSARILSVSGKQLNFVGANKSKMYFDGYADAWK